MWRKVILGGHRIAEVGSDLWRLSGATSPAESKANHSRLLKAVSVWLLNSSKDRDSTASLGDLF